MKRHSGSLMMFAGAVMVLFYPSLWVYGKVSQVYLHQEWRRLPSASKTAGGDSSSIVARLVIPKIWVDQIVVQGVSDSQLARGPAHFPETAGPGAGNCAIIGHLNIDGSPFRDLDKLQPGDLVLLQTHEHLVQYRVVHHQIVMPTDLDVLRQKGPKRLTLITCMPGAKRRYVVTCRQTQED
ncbi:MAG TPA: class D sortase [Armatimonadota bacterium]|nr:class D sortase [Armatimonadota bacterium]